MFCNSMTGHNFTDEATTHKYYQYDKVPTPEDGRLVYASYTSGIAMAALAHAQVAECMTVKEAMAMDCP